MNRLFPGMELAPNAHPVFVHFPIALWLVALAFVGLGAVRGRQSLVGTGRWLLCLGTLGAGLAVLTGYLATDQLGHESPGHDLIHVHRDWMVASSLVALAVSVGALVVRRRTDAITRWALVVALAVLNGLVALGADRGARLVFGYGIGTAGLEPPAETAHEHDHGDHSTEETGAHTGEPLPDEGHEHTHDHAH